MLSRDFRDMFSELAAGNVEFLVVGAFALAAHGLPRATGDLDIWIRPEPENAGRMWLALAQYGAPVQNLSVEELSTPGMFFQIGVVPLRIDILTDIDGVAFEDAWGERVYRDFEGMMVPVLSRKHLLINKRSTGRPKDLADAAWMEEQGSD